MEAEEVTAEQAKDAKLSERIAFFRRTNYFRPGDPVAEMLSFLVELAERVEGLEAKAKE